MFICKRCQLLQSSITGQLSQSEELAHEQHESESAGAQCLMDGNVKCICGGSCWMVVVASIMPWVVQPSARPWNNSTIEMPPGIIPVYDCSICLESYKYAALLCGLPCGHSFHQQCIMGWLGRDNHCCPVCRWPSYKAKPYSHQHFE